MPTPEELNRYGDVMMVLLPRFLNDGNAANDWWITPNPQLGGQLPSLVFFQESRWDDVMAAALVAVPSPDSPPVIPPSPGDIPPEPPAEPTPNNQ